MCNFKKKELLRRTNALITRYFLILVLFTLLFIPISVYAQNGSATVSGIVTNGLNGNPLPGVTVVLKGTTTGAASDVNGRYKLVVPSLNNDTLVFSFVGFTKKSVAIDGRNKIDIQLQPKIVQGKETVITAFGEEKAKEDVVGAVTSFDTYQLGKLKMSASSNLTTSLAGRVAGLIAYQRSGEPGADNANFFVRGVTTFGYNKNPLILIDNIESTPTDLARLNPNDIASFSILKDATATALYGSRAANGVLLIKTNEGSEGKATVRIRVSNAVSMPTQTIKLADPVTYMQLANQAAVSRDPLAPLPYPKQKIINTNAGNPSILYPAVDWMKKLFKKYTVNQKVSLNVNGGGKIARYYVSGSFNQDHGMLKVDPINNFNNNIDLKSYSLRTNVNVNLTHSTELGLKISGIFDDYNGPPNSGTTVYEQVMVSNQVRFLPKYPSDSAHAYIKHPLFGNYKLDGNLLLNPYAEMVRGYRQWNRSTMNAQIFLNQDLSDIITKGLKFNGVINIKRLAYQSVTREYNPFWYRAIPTDLKGDNYSLILLNKGEGTEYLDYLPSGKTVNSTTFFKAQLNYKRNFNDKHIVSGLLVFTGRNRNPDHAVSLQASLPHRNVNLAGRTTYNYGHRYIVEFDFGANASERFSKNHRWGFFPSIGGAWNISNEDFWKSIKPLINSFKIRFSYGLSGNDNIGSGRFLYLSEVSLDDPNRGFTTGLKSSYHLNGISLSRYANSKVTWEKARKTNLGLDLSLFHHLDVNVDIYKQFRSDILEPRVYIPDYMGLSAITEANTGKVKAKGIDVSASYNQYFNNSLFIQFRGNFTYATNEIVQISEFSYRDEPWLSREGYATSQAWGYVADRLFVDEAEVKNSPPQGFGDYSAGDVKYRDVNGDGQITTLDRVPIGYPTTPEITYGLGFSLGYKGFDLSTFFQGLGHESFWILADGSTDIEGNRIGTAPFINNHVLLKAYADSYWSVNKKELTPIWPRFSTDPTKGINNNAQRSTWFLRDGAFLRLKGLQIGYSLPENLIHRFSIEKLRLYLNGSNLLVWSPFKLWDPEMAGLGFGYPPQRVFNVGFNIVF